MNRIINFHAAASDYFKGSVTGFFSEHQTSSLYITHQYQKRCLLGSPTSGPARQTDLHGSWTSGLYSTFAIPKFMFWNEIIYTNISQQCSSSQRFHDSTRWFPKFTHLYGQRFFGWWILSQYVIFLSSYFVQFIIVYVIFVQKSVYHNKCVNLANHCGILKLLAATASPLILV